MPPDAVDVRASLSDGGRAPMAPMASLLAATLESVRKNGWALGARSRLGLPMDSDERLKLGDSMLLMRPRLYAEHAPMLCGPLFRSSASMAMGEECMEELYVLASGVAGALGLLPAVTPPADVGVRGAAAFLASLPDLTTTCSTSCMSILAEL